MVAHPVDTISGMPASVGRFFDRVKLGGESIAQAASAPDKGGMERTADVGRSLTAVFLSAVILMEIIGPIATQWGLRLAGDTAPEDTGPVTASPLPGSPQGTQ